MYTTSLIYPTRARLSRPNFPTSPAEALSQSSASRIKGGVIAEYVATHVVEPDKSKVQKLMQDNYRLRNSIVHDGDASRWLKRRGNSHWM